MITKQTTTYTFQRGDMFIFTTTVGAHSAGDFMLLAGRFPGPNLWTVTSGGAVSGRTAHATASEGWLTEQLEARLIEYAGNVELGKPEAAR